MTKFTDDLEIWVKKEDKNKKNRRKDVFVIEFLAIKKDVVDALKSGYSVKTIWSYLSEKEIIKSKYETFRLHIKKFIKPCDLLSDPEKKEIILAAKINNDKQDSEDKKNNKKKVIPKENKSSKSKGFSFNPKPNQEDLI